MNLQDFLAATIKLKDVDLVEIKCDHPQHEGGSLTLKKVVVKRNITKNERFICRVCYMAHDNPAKRDSSKAKARKTNLERYGTTCTMNTPEQIAARSEKFNDPEFVERWNEKRRKTSQERYGTDHPTQSEEVRTKIEATTMINHGVRVPLQSEAIREKVKQTCLERYGVENPAQLEAVREKMADTTEDRYGVRHYNQLPEMREYLRDNCTTWLADSYANPWAKGTTRPEEWNEKQSQTMTRLLLEGKIVATHKGCVRGYYSSQKCKRLKAFFRSHLELVVHDYLTLNNGVDSYDYEPFAIPYITKEGQNRNYVPDFIVKYNDGSPLRIVEVKPRYMHENKDNREKMATGMAYSLGNDMTFEVWDEVLIRRLHPIPHKDILKKECVDYLCLDDIRK